MNANGNSLAWLVRKPARVPPINSLTTQGFRVGRERAFDMEKFRKVYDPRKLVTWNCG